MASSLLISPHNLLCSTTFHHKHALFRHRRNTVGLTASEKTYLMSPRCTRSLVLTPGGSTLTEMAKGREGVVAPGIGIVRFISGKNLFVTGATGFLAKVLIEKILRTVPQVGKVFLLIKAKNTEAAMDRLKHQILEADLFKCLKKIHGRGYESFMLSKLIPVAGNVCEPELGMDGETANTVAGAVNIVVNSVVIIRPSVIESTYKEPFPGWIEGNRFDSSNTESLMEIMSNEERREFGFDVRSIDWRDYISNVHIPGLRKHVMKGRGVCNIA